MPKTTQNILLEDLYRTKTSSAISSSGDISFTVTTPPQNKKGYILVEPDNDSKREKMFYHDVVGNTIYVKGINRINPTDHIIGVNVQINDTALIFNHLFEQDATTFYCEKTGNLSLNVWGGPVLRGTETISIADTPLTILNNTTNYIYYKSETNEILTNTSESTIATDKGIVVAEIIAASGIITSIKYRNHKFSIGNFISSVEETSVSGRTHTYTITFTDGTTFEYDVFDGKSAYEVAVDEGFIGTEEQWLISIRGEKGVIWRGAFNIATAYIPYDLVSYQGTTYINIVASTGVLPTNPTNFEIFASRGDDGDVSSTDLSNAIDGVTTAFQNADLTLLPNPITSSKSANYTLLAIEKNNTVFSMNTSGGNRTFTLDPALFPTTNGCFVFTFVKSTSDANTVTIDVGSGNTIDGSQTYILTQQNESVTIVIQSSTFAKVLCTNKKLVIPTVNRVKFGGDGSDGVLNISSGTTSLTLINNQIVRKYESINISGSAILDIVGATGTNGGIAYIKCLGDFTMSGGTLRMNGQGGAGGAGGASQSTPGQPGGNGLSLLGIPDFYSKGGVPGTTYQLAGIAQNSPGYIGFSETLAAKLQKICAGSGGAGGSMSNSAFTQGGAGGAGGGLLIIEIGGVINFTGGTIQANGANGSPGSAANGRGGSGGGGSGGSILIMYNGFIANSGTIQCNGGNGANGITGGSSGYTEASGGSGGSGFLASIGGNGSIGGATASNGTSNAFGTGGTGGTSVGSDAGGAGGGGAAGYYLVVKNTEIA